jgi:hypothetical protein
MEVATIRLSLASGLSAKGVVDRILAEARQRGIDQTCLARRADIAPESLSRIKRTGKCRLDTALALAYAAGFQKLDLRQHGPHKTALPISAKKLSASRRLDISVQRLLGVLTSGKLVPRFRAHLIGFFEELPIELVHDVILDERLDYEVLIKLTRELGAEGETIEWLKEMAGDSLANVA